MSVANNNFRYTIMPVGFIDTIVVPLGESDFKIEWTREDEQKIQYKKEQPSKITFTGAAFQQLLEVENSTYRCQYIPITVERRCIADGAESWQTWFTGRLTNNEGEWDLDRCLVEVKADRINADQCYEDNKNVEVNLFDHIPTRHTVKSYDGTTSIETVEYTGSTGTCGGPYFPGDPHAGFWVCYYYHNFSFIGLCTSITRWARQVLIVGCSDPAPGPDWHLIATDCPGTGKKYVREATVYNCEDTTEGHYFTHTCDILGVGGFNFIDNGMSLKDVLETFASMFCDGVGVVSDFLQINPENVSSDNPVTGDETKTDNIFVFQKSDVKRPDAFNNATKAIWTFEKCLNAICEMFNLRYRFLDDGTTLRIEHISYWGQTSGLDLTIDRYKKFVLWKQKYTYTKEKIPSKEVYKFMEAQRNSDFEGLPIVYSGACVSEAGRENITTHNVDDVTTDVNYCLLNPAGDNSNVSDSGFVIIATKEVSGDNVIITEDPILGDRQINNSLAWAQLHRDYHKYYRPLINGNMNGADTVFISARPTKKGETITVPLCCYDVFNPDDKVTTAFGDGVVEKAVYSFKDQTLQLDLLYEIEDLVPNARPVAVSDTFNVNQLILTGTYLDVLANDIDPDGDIVNVVIVNPPLHGTAVVQMDLTILYIMTPGYLGLTDIFTYKVVDSFGRESNIALVNINLVG